MAFISPRQHLRNVKMWQYALPAIVFHASTGLLVTFSNHYERAQRARSCTKPVEAMGERPGREHSRSPTADRSPLIHVNAAKQGYWTL
jgi:hypothetical protein